MEKPTKRILSGVQPSGDLHLGNYLGAIKNFVTLQKEYECFFCVVDLHAITVWQDPKVLANKTREVTAAFIASGIDPNQNNIFVQSQVPQHAQLGWLFNCVARMGWLNRMTQFKDKAGKNSENVSVGLFSYPTLMAADILIFNATHVPVGSDQIQHLEMTRDIAGRFNHIYKHDLFNLPEAITNDDAKTIPGLDGRKMSKSYNNVIPFLCSEKELQKGVMRIVTNSLEPGVKKDTKDCNLFTIYSSFASNDQIDALRNFMLMGWVGVKLKISI